MNGTLQRIGLDQNQVASLLTKFKITIRTDGKACEARHASKGVINNRARCGEVSTRIMAKAHKLKRFTWAGLSKYSGCTKSESKNAIRRLFEHGELVSTGMEPGPGGLMIYEIRNTVKLKP